VSIASDEIPELSMVGTSALEEPGTVLPDATVVVSNCREESTVKSDREGRFSIELSAPQEGRSCDWILADHAEHYGLRVPNLGSGHAGFAEHDTVYLIKLPRLENPKACPPGAAPNRPADQR